MIQRKTEKTTRKKSAKNEYVVDGKKYKSKILYEAHLEFAEAVKKHLIQTFALDGLGKKSRYTSYKPILDEIKFDSLMEAKYYLYLRELEKAKKIHDLELQVPYLLQEGFSKNGKKYRPISYVADFRYVDKDGVQHVVDIKGKETVEFKLKQKLFEYKYPDLSLSVIQLYEGQWLELSASSKGEPQWKVLSNKQSKQSNGADWHSAQDGRTRFPISRCTRIPKQ